MTTMKMVLETADQKPYMNIDSGQCPGCPSNLATKLVMNLLFQVCEERRQDPLIIGQGCGIGRNILQRSGIGTHDSAAVAIKTAMEIRGVDRPVVVIDGDGQLDMGFDDFTGSFQLGYPYIHVVCDNQSYAASGSHATGMTDLLAQTSTRPTGRVGSPDGHLAGRKHPGMMIMFSGARYSATLAPSHIRDFERKVLEALDNMPAFLHVFTPCSMSWGYNDEDSYRVTRLGVESGVWPLWEWHRDEGFRRTFRPRPEEADAKLQEYLKSQRRFAHLEEEDLPIVRQYVAEENRLVERLALAFAPES